MKYCNIKPEDINDESIEKYIQKLKEYPIEKSKGVSTKYNKL